MLKVTVEKNLESGETAVSDVDFVPIVTHYGANFRDITIYPLSQYSAALAEQHGVRQYDSIFSLSYIEPVSYTHLDVYKRQDRDTTGVLVLAKNPYAAARLAQGISKVYLAVCEGVLEGSGTEAVSYTHLKPHITGYKWVSPPDSSETNVKVGTEIHVCSD